MTQPKVEFGAISAGYEFPPARFQLDWERVKAYLEAVEGDTRRFEASGTVPPMAVAALSMAALAEGLVMPPGTIHVSQSLEFLKPAGTGAPLTSQAVVKRKLERAGMRMLTVSINVTDEHEEPVLGGETSFVVPPAGEKEQ